MALFWLMRGLTFGWEMYEEIRMAVIISSSRCIRISFGILGNFFFRLLLSMLMRFTNTMIYRYLFFWQLGWNSSLWHSRHAEICDQHDVTILFILRWAFTRNYNSFCRVLKEQNRCQDGENVLCSCTSHNCGKHEEPYQIIEQLFTVNKGNQHPCYTIDDNFPQGMLPFLEKLQKKYFDVP